MDEPLLVAHLPGCDFNGRRRSHEIGAATELISLVLAPPHPVYLGRPEV